MRAGKSWRPALIALAGALVASSEGCRREEVAHARLPKEQALPDAGAPGAGPMGGGPMGGGPMAGGPMAGDVPAPPRPTGAGALKWSLPKGWTETGGSGMRYATLKPPVEGRIDVSVVVLPGMAGGELANVNRWRGQIGLPALDEASLASARKEVDTKAGKVSLYDFESGGQSRTRMIAGLLETTDGNTWFLKMVGDAGVVAASRSNFLRLLETLHLD